MRSLLFVGGGILIGVGLTWTEAYISAENRHRNHYDSAIDAHKRAMDEALKLAQERQAETPVETEAELTFNEEGSILETNVRGNVPAGYIEEYVQKASVYGDPSHFQPGNQPIEFIDDDTYSEDDGNSKEIIQVFMGDGEPYFVQDGIVITDWKEKLGENILVAFYQNFGPNAEERVLWVRNNTLNEDYEVVQEMGP